jgi:hypothetical protein
VPHFRHLAQGYGFDISDCAGCGIFAWKLALPAKRKLRDTNVRVCVRECRFERRLIAPLTPIKAVQELASGERSHNEFLADSAYGKTD